MAETAASGRLPAPRKVALRDGSEVLLRPARADDGDLVRRAFDALSERSRYLRFHAHVTHLGDDQIHMVTSADHRAHAVWVALDPDAPVDTIVGLASYVRLDRPGDVAEGAVAVADAFQGRGLGTILLGVLVDVARHHGIACFRNYVLAENAPMLQLFDELGAERQPLDGHVHVVDLILPEHLDELPDTPSGRAIRALAGGECGSALVAFHPPLWMLRKRMATLPQAVPQPRGPRERADLAAWLDEVLADRPDERAEDGPAEEGEQATPQPV
jgi:RimJ/RimL family protein N-acetyltransferase